MLHSIPGLKNFCSIQRFAFLGLAIDLTSTECKIRRPFLIWLTFFCSLIFTLGLVLYCWENLADFDEFLTTLSILLLAPMMILRLVVYLKKRSDMAKLVRKIWMLTNEAKTDELSIIAEENAKDFKFTLCYYITMSVMCLAAVLLPLCITMVMSFKAKQLQYFFIIKTSYPFDQNQPFNYFVAYCIHIGCGYSFGHITVAIDTLYSWLILNTAAQFRIVKLDLKKVALSHKDSEMNSGIKRCIRRHQRIIGITNEIDNFYRILIFGEILTNCIVLCLEAYQLGHSDGNLKNVPFIMGYFMSVMIRLIIYCYGGQRIQDESQNIAGFIYETFPWHSITQRNKKLLLIFMLRADKCCNLSGYFFIPNYKLFLWILQTNYSYLSILWSMEKKPIT